MAVQTPPKPSSSYATKYLAGAGYAPYKTKLPPILPKPKKPTVVKTKTTAVNPFAGIETPEQIEARVRRVSQEDFDRQRNTLREEADALRRDAANRRASTLAAYQAAARLNAGMGADVQAGWQSAGSGITAGAQAVTGGIGEALRGALASDQAQLAAAGAPELAYDATSQQGVENYRGGFLPRAYFEAMGGTGRQYMNEAAMALGARGLQTGMFDESQALQGIDKDFLSQVRELTQGRTAYEADLRKQLLGAASDQQTAVLKQQTENAKLRLAAQKQLDYLRVKKAELDSKYRIARLSATTAAQKLEVDKWYKTNSLLIDNAKAQAYQQGQAASANLANVKASVGGFAPKADTNPQVAYRKGFDTMNVAVSKAVTREPVVVQNALTKTKQLAPQFTGPGAADRLREYLWNQYGATLAGRFPKQRETIRSRLYSLALATLKAYPGSEVAAEKSSGLTFTG